MSMDEKTLEHLRENKVPETDIAELARLAEFLRARKAYREARDRGEVTDEMRREYVGLIEGLAN